MTRNYEEDDDRDLPWDPMWAYVLGEDIDERDSRCDDGKHRQHDFSFGSSTNSSYRETHRDDGRDGTDGSNTNSILPTGLLKNLWKRKEKDQSATTSSTTSMPFISRQIPRKSQSVDREEWAWELDLMPSATSKSNEKRDGSQDKSSWLTAKKSLDSSSWVGKHRSLSLRKFP